MRYFLFCLAFSFPCLAQTQELNLAIGQWRAHLPYKAGPYVTQSDKKVFFATEWAIVTIDKTDQSVEYLDKVKGLSNTGVELIKYNQGSQVLIVVYQNSIIDLVYEDGEIVTLNQIPNFANFVGEKTIYDIFVESDSTVLLAANYGISRLNIRKPEFAFTTFTGVGVYGITNWNDQIYLGTEDGQYRIEADNPNPENFGNWLLLGPNEGFPSSYTSFKMANYQGDLYLDIDDSIYQFDGSVLHLVFTAPEGYDLSYLSGSGRHLLAGYRCSSGCSQGRVYYLSGDGSQGQLPGGCAGIPQFAVEDEQGRIWFGDRWRNFRMLPSITSDACNWMSFNSPFSQNNKEIAIHNNQVWMVAGGVTQTFNYRFLDHGFASFIDGQWTIYNRGNTNAIKGVDPNSGDDDLFDFITVAINPQNGKVYAGSFFEGLLEIDGDQIMLYNDLNSSLGNAVGDSKRTRISGLAFDGDNNLWISNHTAEFPVSVFTHDGIWKKFKPSCGVGEIHQLDVDLNGYKWIVSNSSSAGVLVFDEGDFKDPNDDRCRVFTQNNSNLPTNNVNCLAVDQDGDVWVGTSEGIILFECGSGVFEPECLGSTRIFNQDGFNEYLLGTEEVQTIAVDGGNRKWVGTKNGVFVISPDGEEEIAHFTENNSPLLDNNIIDIAINDQNGEVFIGTDKGIISYRGQATAGGRVHSSTVEVFPNPVRPEYRGPIAIRGLSRDATVKITDINGRLVFETKALGGQAIWEGTDYNGRRVSTGVYLVFSADNPRNAGFDKPSSAAARIVFIR